LFLVGLSGAASFFERLSAHPLHLQLKIDNITFQPLFYIASRSSVVDGSGNRIRHDII